jgi:hypothetical protein
MGCAAITQPDEPCDSCGRARAVRGNFFISSDRSAPSSPSRCLPLRYRAPDATIDRSLLGPCSGAPTRSPRCLILERAKAYFGWTDFPASSSPRVGREGRRKAYRVRLGECPLVG